MTRFTSAATLALTVPCMAVIAQSASVSFSAPSSTVAPGSSVTVTLSCDYDVAGAASGVFGAAGFYGFGGDVTASGSGAGDASASTPQLLAALDSGDVAMVGVGGSLVRAAAGRGLGGGIAVNPASPLTFEVDIAPTATPGATVTVDFDGAVVLVRGDALETFSTSPGVGQSSLGVTPLVLTIGAAGCSPADITTTGSANGTPDGVVDLSDFSFYLTLWSASDAQADITTTGSSNGVPDSVVDLSDFSFYLTLWSAGCP